MRYPTNVLAMSTLAIAHEIVLPGREKGVHATDEFLNQLKTNEPDMYDATISLVAECVKRNPGLGITAAADIFIMAMTFGMYAEKTAAKLNSEPDPLTTTDE